MEDLNKYRKGLLDINPYYIDEVLYGFLEYTTLEEAKIETIKYLRNNMNYNPITVLSYLDGVINKEILNNEQRRNIQ